MKLTFSLKRLASTTLLSSIVAAAQTSPPSAHTDAANAPNAIRVLLSAELETTLASQMVGRITTLNASLGSAVSKGRVIVAFDCSEANAKLQMAEADYAMARETLETKNNLRKLEAAGDMEVTLAAAAADRAKATIAVSRTLIAQCTVLAPFSGRIVKLHAKPFQGVTMGTPLVEMVSDGPLKLRLNVPSKLLRSLRIGTPFEVDIDETGKTYLAKITAMNARVDAVSQTLELEARIDGRPVGLLAGMTGIARVKGP
ncbi:MAG: efflux RND transporter periplasmic adaptor subunit [Rhodoferax sp.]|uniref:efflux RND transporter periplasmic adaptor subunit n=1 Tax=Rhodoferax sp. TaxID=50421 RepID=UPI0027374F46|nr:efflux RND transporter periplasmic adaptor subunit [Rhodoferax sp.]MDP2677452.1 efflux RND transporter periplasmic adaptor subunit [Rhodoferax sp.]